LLDYAFKYDLISTKVSSHPTTIAAACLPPALVAPTARAELRRRTPEHLRKRSSVPASVYPLVRAVDIVSRHSHHLRVLTPITSD